MSAEPKQTKWGGKKGKQLAQFGWSSGLVLHSLCQLASWAFVAVLITVLPGVGGENSPRGTVSSGTFHQEANNCLPAQLGGIPPGSEGRGCGRVLPGSAHASCGAGRTCGQLASRFRQSPVAVRCSGAGMLPRISYFSPSGSAQGSGDLSFCFVLFFLLPFLCFLWRSWGIGPVLSPRG